MIRYVLNRPKIVVPTTTKKPATLPNLIPLPVPFRVPSDDHNMADNGEIDDGVRHSIDETPRHLIDSNLRLYNESPVSYSKSSFRLPKIRIGRNVN